MQTILTKTAKAGTVTVEVAIDGPNLVTIIDGVTICESDSAIVMAPVKTPVGTFRHMLQHGKVVLTDAEYQTIRDAEQAYRDAMPKKPLPQDPKWLRDIKQFERDMERADSAL